MPIASSEPSGAYAAVTPNDSANLPGGVCRALYVGTSGNVALWSEGSQTTVVFNNVLGGSILPVRALRVLAAGSGTTASNIIALY